ncbi:hypothetical protein HDU82_005776 [Entophlyctis luteolus]|nr:hypothetical protein HDU82_005776 [Entophlyctis luteolus]
MESEFAQSETEAFESARPQGWSTKLVGLASRSHAVLQPAESGGQSAMLAPFVGVLCSQPPHSTQSALALLSIVSPHQPQYFLQSAAHHAHAAGMHPILDGAIEADDAPADVFAVNQHPGSNQYATSNASDPLMFSTAPDPQLKYSDFLCPSDHHHSSFLQQSQEQAAEVEIVRTDRDNLMSVADHALQPQGSTKRSKRGSKLNISASTTKPSAPQRRRWTPAEVSALEAGMHQYGTNWAGLLNDAHIGPALARRTQMQCKDKAAVEKERRVKRALREGCVVGVHELGVWRYACDRKRAFANVTAPMPATEPSISTAPEESFAEEAGFDAVFSNHIGLDSTYVLIVLIPVTKTVEHVFVRSMSTTLDDDYESVLLVIRECTAYRIPPRTAAKGYRAGDWDVNAFLWKGRLRIIARGSKADCFINLEDATTGELFAACPYPPDGSTVEPVLDSSRYFVLTLVDPGSGRKAYIGLGFLERSDAFDFNVALQDHAKRLKNAGKPKTVAATSSFPSIDFSLKDDQKFSIHIGGVELAHEVAKKKPASASSSISSIPGLSEYALPPPPLTSSSTLVPPPPPPAHHAMYAHQNAAEDPFAALATTSWPTVTTGTSPPKTSDDWANFGEFQSAASNSGATDPNGWATFD